MIHPTLLTLHHRCATFSRWASHVPRARPCCCALPSSWRRSWPAWQTCCSRWWSSTGMEHSCLSLTPSTGGWAGGWAGGNGEGGGAGWPSPHPLCSCPLTSPSFPAPSAHPSVCRACLPGLMLPCRACLPGLILPCRACLQVYMHAYMPTHSIPPDLAGPAGCLINPSPLPSHPSLPPFPPYAPATAIVHLPQPSCTCYCHCSPATAIMHLLLPDDTSLLLPATLLLMISIWSGNVYTFLLSTILF